MRKLFLKSCVVILLSLLPVSNIQAGIDFDGADDFVSAADFLSGNQTNLSVSAWVYYDTSNTDDYISNYSNATNAVGYLFLRDDVSAGTGRTDCFTASLNAVTTDYVIASATNSAPSGQWFHVCFTFSSTADALRLYINGVEDANSPVTSGSGALVEPTGSLYLAALNGIAATNVADGKITEFALWTATLTDAEVLLLASSRIKNIPLQIQSASLKLYFPMDDQEAGSAANGDTVRDLSGNGNNGTGNDGANNTGLTWVGETVLSYPPKPISSL